MYANTESLIGNCPRHSTGKLALALLCTVCGDIATGNHFGAQSCEGCKGFFRRSVRSSQLYECLTGFPCIIDKKTRTRCRHCRMLKCIAAGMKMEAVQVDNIRHDQPTRVHKLRAESPSPLREEEGAVPAHLHRNVLYNASPRLCHPAPFSKEGSAQRLSPTSAYDTFEVLMNAEELLKGQKSPQVTVPVDRPVTLDNGLDGLKCCFLSMLEWMHCIPEFVQLDLEDKNKLIRSCWCDLCTLQFAVQNWPMSSSLVLANGLSFQYDQIQDQAFQNVVDRVLNEVTPWLGSMSINTAEIAHIKALLLFNSGANLLSPESRALVQCCQDQIIFSLDSYIQRQYPLLPLRSSQILMQISSVKSASQIWWEHAKLEQLKNCDSLLSGLFDFI